MPILPIASLPLQVGSKRWRVDIHGRGDAVLHLSMVSMPGGAQRRRTFEDQLNMRSLFKENDLISAEVHTVHADGQVLIHARNLKYGKVRAGDDGGRKGGVFCRVPPPRDL
jgi:exosome complex component RRP4